MTVVRAQIENTGKFTERGNTAMPRPQINLFSDTLICVNFVCNLPSVILSYPCITRKRNQVCSTRERTHCSSLGKDQRLMMLRYRLLSMLSKEFALSSIRKDLILTNRRVCPSSETKLTRYQETRDLQPADMVEE